MTTLLPVIPGLAALAIVTDLLPASIRPAAFLGLLLLAASSTGRWPVTGTGFAALVICACLPQRGLHTWDGAAVGLLLGVYLLALDARESAAGPADLMAWARTQPLNLLAVVAAVAGVLLGELLEVRAPVVLVLVGAAAATVLLAWVSPDRRQGPGDPH